MVFSSLFFVFAFLPVTLALYYMAGKRYWNVVLLTASLFFYAWGEPVYVVLMCASILVNYFLGLFLCPQPTKERKVNTFSFLGVSKTCETKRKLIFIVSIIFNVGYLAFFKYLGLIINVISLICGFTPDISVPALPIGISFYTFQALSYMIDSYRGKIKPQKNLLAFALYISMFPQLIAGPIVSYEDIESRLIRRDINLEAFYSGFQRFLCGLAKKVLLANNIGMLWAYVKTSPIDETTVLIAWVGIISFTLQIYFDFSGYSDMALGLGKMFGFHFKENFNYPYISRSVSEFWRRWHISLGSWFREYVYIPLGGNKGSKPKLIRNLLAVWLLTGLWHGASFNFILWGLYFGALIFIEKYFYKEPPEQQPKIIGHIYLLLSVTVGWVFFEFNNLSDISGFLRVMLGLSGNTFADTQTAAVLKDYTALLIICIIGTTPIPKNIATDFLRKHDNIYKALEPIFCCVLMFFVTAYMVGTTYNPFIYFRF